MRHLRMYNLPALFGMLEAVNGGECLIFKNHMCSSSRDLI